MNFGAYLADEWPDILELAIEHLEVVLISVAIAAAIAITAGIVIERWSRASGVVLSSTALLLTIPSFALFGLLIPLVGLGYAPTVVALILYALYPILRNTVTGLRSVDVAVIDVAKGMGLSWRQQLLRVRLPLAWPVILTGIRVATMMLVAIAAIGAAVSGPGLGSLIFDGLARIGGANALNDALAGVLGVVVVALVLDLLYVLLARLTTSRGIRA
ncbi:MAG: ABC transporter permease [Streptosporangiales bacterium]